MLLTKGILNHGELVIEYSKALVQIGEVLPRQELNAALFPTPHMKDAISRLYAHILKFLLRAVKWYQMSPAGRAFSAIRKPFDLDLKDIVEQVWLCSERIEKIASTASKAELRDVHLKISGIQSNMDDAKVNMSAMQSSMGDMGIKIKQLFQIALSQFASPRLLAARTNIRAIDTQSLNSRIHVDMRGLSSRLVLQQLSSIQDHGSSLEEPRKLYLSLANRRQDRMHMGRDSAPLLENMNNWITTPGPSAHVIRAGSRAGKKCKDLAAIVVDLLLASNHKVVWSLSSCINSMVCNDILKSLVHQAVQYNPRIVFDTNVSFPALNDIHTATEWLDLLRLVMTGFSESGLALFLVVETEDAQLIDLIHKVIKSTNAMSASSRPHVKILLIVSSSVVDIPAVPPTASNISMSFVHQAPPVPAKLRRTRRIGRGGIALTHALISMLSSQERPTTTES